MAKKMLLMLLFEGRKRSPGVRAFVVRKTRSFPGGKKDESAFENEIRAVKYQ